MKEEIARDDANDADEQKIHSVSLSVSLPAADSFHRAFPAELEGPADAWRVARATVDYGCAILANGAPFRGERALRDAVLAALLRRLLITTEGVVVLLSRGLLEPALSESRTLLDIGLAIRLIHADSTDRFVQRLAAFHYLTYQEHGQDMLANRPTRTGMLDGGSRIEELVTITKSYARYLEATTFDEVREDLKNDIYWHGYRNAKQAFTAIGAESDYFMSYDSATWFVHAVNVDHDFDRIDQGGMVLKPLVQRDPVQIQPLLGYVCLRCIELIAIYLTDTGLDLDGATNGGGEMTLADGSRISLGSIHALRMLALKQFDIRETGFGQGAPAEPSD